MLVHMIEQINTSSFCKLDFDGQDDCQWVGIRGMTVYGGHRSEGGSHQSLHVVYFAEFNFDKYFRILTDQG